MLKACSICGRIHKRGEICPKAAKRRYLRREEERGRYTYAFAKLSQQIKARQSQLCPLCLLAGDLRPNPLETHHIEKIVDRPDLLLDDANLIALCNEHHRQADEGEIGKPVLRDLAAERDESESPPAWVTLVYSRRETTGPTQK